MKTYSYADSGRGSGGVSVRWNGIALIGRQGIILVFSIVLARMLGPEAYGIVAQATVITALASLLLDQGLTASLISQPTISGRLVGAASTVNLALSVGLAALTWGASDALGEFFDTPELKGVLQVLAATMILKAAATVPRMLLTREGRFQAIAGAEVSSSLFGGVIGLAAALAGAGYWSIVCQLIATDFIAAIVLIASARPPFPNLNLTSLRGSIAFGLRVFVGNLIAFTSRNIDNVLVGRFLGTAQLGYYALAYRVLLTPVQLIGQTVTRVLFPAISVVRGNRTEVSRLMVKSTRGIALAAFPMMTLIAVSAADTTRLVLGEEWSAAVPVIQILALTGARQAVTSTNSPLLLGVNRSDLHLRFNVVAAVVQVSGIVAGLPFGIIGVAWGYTIAGIVLTPVIAWLQKRLAGTTYSVQIAILIAPAVACVIAALPYLLLLNVEIEPLRRLAFGGLAFLTLYYLVNRYAFAKDWAQATGDLRSLLPSRRKTGL